MKATHALSAIAFAASCLQSAGCDEHTPCGDEQLCNGACADVRRDPANCGECGATCDGPCSEGVCAHAHSVAVAWGLPDTFVGGGYCVLLDDGVVRCGRPDSPRQAWRSDVASGIAQIDAGLSAYCLRAALGGSVLCAGSNRHFELGRLTTEPFTRQPGRVNEISEAVDIGVGDAIACALRANGSVGCWGRIWGYETYTPLELNFASRQVDIEVGGPICGVDESGAVACVAADVRPEPVDLPMPATAVALGGGHGCALLSDGTVACWGANNHGQLGRGTTTPVVHEGVAVVDGLDDVRALVAGQDGTCATLESGAAWCWGANFEGQLGLEPQTDVLVPTELTAVGRVRAVALGLASHGCAIRESGELVCWNLSGPGVSPVAW